MITLRNITIRRGANILLQDINWTIYQKQRIGIIGANGVGKTSLFGLLLNELQPDKGDIEFPRQIKLAQVAQETPGYQRSSLEFVLDGDAELRAIQQELIIAEANNDGEQIARLHAQLAEIDAYSAEARAAQILSGLGFNHAEQQKSVNEFSGGWRVRLNLAKALMCRSDVLLLDEPTNHLDLDAVLWLENWLRRYQGTLLLISHDRDFLDCVVEQIAHVYQQNIIQYTGNYSSFEKQRAAQILLQQAAYEKQQKKLAHLQSFVDRFRAKASKARQAQSRLKAIARMELVDVVKIDQSFEFHFKEPAKCPNPLVQLDDAVVAYDNHIVLTGLNLSLAPKDRIALLGPNGAGKSSLIKLIAKEIDPASGIRFLGEGLKIGYFAQHQIDYLNLEEAPLYHLRKIAPDKKEQELRSFLGSFGFTNSRVLEPIKHFSGGEKSRLALSLIIWQKPNLLLLDEPTNHLDLDMRHALSMALQEYQGALILVSHDRFLVRATVDQLLLIANGKLQAFDGDLDDYEKWLLAFRKQERIESTAKNNQAAEKAQRKSRENSKSLLQKINKYEVKLATLQQEIQKIEEKLSDATLYANENKDKLQIILDKQSELSKQLATTEQEWLQCSEKLENLSSEE